MISVEMGNKDACDACGGSVGKNKLSLCAFAGIKEKPFFVPAEKVAPMIAVACGLLARTSKYGYVSYSHFLNTFIFANSPPTAAPLK